MRAKLVVVGGSARAAEISLRLPVTIGRGHAATLTLPHPLVSRKHCELFEVDDQLMVRDLGSLNGTYVGNERITEAALPSGELLTIGTVTFRAVYDESADLDDTELPPSAAEQAGAEQRGAEQADESEAMIAPMSEQTEVEFPVPKTDDQPIAVDRETEWQPGSNPAPDDSGENEDFRSFLNELP